MSKSKVVHKQGIQTAEKYIGFGQYIRVKGVVWNSRFCLWQVRIGDNNKRFHIGYFKTFDEAVNARKHAEMKFNYHENHGA